MGDISALDVLQYLEESLQRNEHVSLSKTNLTAAKMVLLQQSMSYYALVSRPLCRSKAKELI